LFDIIITVWAGGFLEEPLVNAILVEFMTTTWELPDGISFLVGKKANRTI